MLIDIFAMLTNYNVVDKSIYKLISKQLDLLIFRI